MPRRLIIGAVLLFMLVGSGDAQPGFTLADYLKEADGIVIGTLDKRELIGILYSLPPVYGSTLYFTPETVVRGPFKKGMPFTAFHSVRQMDEPKFPVGKKVVLTLEHDRDRKLWVVKYLEIANDDNVKLAKAAK